MAQSSISEFFPVKKRRGGSHASIKRRKLSETTRLDIPVVHNSSDTSSIPLTEPAKVKTTLSIVTPPLSQSSTVTPPLSRGAALVRLAQQKSPVKSSKRVTRQRRHKILESRADVVTHKPPESRADVVTHKPPESRADVVTHKPPESRADVVRAMHKLSARELAAPTKHEVKKKPNMREFRSLEIESPKKDKNRVPAYQRFHSLTKTTPTVGSESDLPLPLSYQLLSEKFRCTDTVVNMLQKRQEIATFSKLKRAVQEMSRRDFELRNLAQMKTVYPTAFTFRQESNIPGSPHSRHQLTVECNTDDPSGCLNPTDLIKRRKTFHRGLVSLVKDQHCQFLSRLSPPLTIPDDKVLRWHPEFSLDRLPDVPESSLPRPPVKDGVSSAADVLRAAQERLAPRVQTALANSVTQEGGAEDKEEAPPTDPIDPALKGVSQVLLDKIRAKEAAKARAKITRDPLKEKHLEMVARLPEFVRILRGFFVGEKKSALLWEEVVSKLNDSTLSRLSTECVGEHLTYLSKLTPSWMTLITIKKKRYVKLDKRRSVKAVLETIQQAENELKH